LIGNIIGLLYQKIEVKDRLGRFKRKRHIKTLDWNNLESGLLIFKGKEMEMRHLLRNLFDTQ
jgi:hypothetical protein